MNGGEVIQLDVSGLPPGGSRGPSALAAGSRYRDQTVALLEAAREAMRRGEVAGFGSKRLRLEVVVHAGPAEAWDASHYLDAIANVLERKAKRLKAYPGSLDHLPEDLVEVALYDDDRQIKEISYREVASDSDRYTVTLAPLDEADARQLS